MTKREVKCDTVAVLCYVNKFIIVLRKPFRPTLINSVVLNTGLVGNLTRPQGARIFGLTIVFGYVCESVSAGDQHLI